MAPKKISIIEENVNLDNENIKESKTKTKVEKDSLIVDNDNESKPIPKAKSKAKAKPSIDNNDDNESKPIPKAKSKAKPSPDNNDDPNDDNESKPKTKAKSKAKSSNENDDSINDDSLIINKSTLKPKVKKVVDSNKDDTQPDNISDIKPKAKAKTKAKAKAKIDTGNSDDDSVKEIKSINKSSIEKIDDDNDSNISDDIILDDNNQYLISIIHNNITYADIDKIINSNDILKKENLVNQIRDMHSQRLKQAEIIKNIINKIEKYDKKDIKQLQYILDKNNNSTNCLTSKTITTNNKQIINHDTETNSDIESSKSDSDIKPLIVNKKKKVININESEDSDNSE